MNGSNVTGVAGVNVAGAGSAGAETGESSQKATTPSDLISLFSVKPASTGDANKVAINDIGGWLNGGNNGTSTGGFQA